jgi:hypothetical protein
MFESTPSPAPSTTSQTVVIETQLDLSASTNEKSQKVPRLSKKRQNKTPVEDELAQAIIQSLSTPDISTPLGQSVSSLENELNQRGHHRLKLQLKQRINDLLAEIEGQSLDLLE